MPFEQPKENLKENQAPKPESILEQRISQPVVDVAQVNKKDEELSARAKEGLDSAIRQAGADDRAAKAREAMHQEYIGQIETLDATIAELEQGISGFFRKFLKLGAEYRDLVKKRDDVAREAFDKLGLGPKELGTDVSNPLRKLRHAKTVIATMKQPKI
jgi:hypothetical protein